MGEKKEPIRTRLSFKRNTFGSGFHPKPTSFNEALQNSKVSNVHSGES